MKKLRTETGNNLSRPNEYSRVSTKTDFVSVLMQFLFTCALAVVARNSTEKQVAKRKVLVSIVKVNPFGFSEVAL